jgi:hypothetical protein
LSWPRRRKLSAEQRGKVEGYRSGLEVQIAEQLREAGVDAKYESVTIRFTYPPQAARYKPDFVLPNGIIIESKGRFLTKDRKKHLQIQEQHPDLDIRFVFSNSRTRISKQSKTTYAVWCDSNELKYADKYIPPEWLTEPANTTSLAALARITGD